ncbi:hypothetical protein BpHYR1_053202 [Brachionus plicatilis]|uniref:Uncharacterized protein n=1 Tax=Brachionus plicatilis TaxID=10195 RepID=A0A3M7PVY6_BRAPC|nr:hypothetical protein BpHYR1_053202 [Brachionus plicatilis]
MTSLFHRSNLKLKFSYFFHKTKNLYKWDSSSVDRRISFLVKLYTSGKLFLALNFKSNPGSDNIPVVQTDSCQYQEYFLKEHELSQTWSLIRLSLVPI